MCRDEMHKQSATGRLQDAAERGRRRVIREEGEVGRHTLIYHVASTYARRVGLEATHSQTGCAIPPNPAVPRAFAGPLTIAPTGA